MTVGRYLTIFLPLAMVLLSAWGSGCVSSQSVEVKVDSLHSPNPATRLRAIRRAAARNNPEDIPSLIEALESDDPAVRFMAIQTLRHMTGRAFGFDYAAPPWQRSDAIDAWQSAWKAGELDIVDHSLQGLSKSVDAGKKGASTDR